jgi:hypothetical protein
VWDASLVVGRSEGSSRNVCVGVIVLLGDSDAGGSEITFCIYVFRADDKLAIESGCGGYA